MTIMVTIPNIQNHTAYHQTNVRWHAMNKDMKKDLKLASLNVRSLSGKSLQVFDLITSEGIDVLLLQETWLADDDGSGNHIFSLPPPRL